MPGPETGLLAQAAKEAGTYLSIGVSERDLNTATLYNTNLIFSPEGALVSVHRKLKPTGAERVVWGDAQQDYFPVVDTPWGAMGSLICWESYMPLARVALYEKGVSLYISPNTNDNEEWQATIRHIAIEGHCYFINSDMFFTRDTYPQDLHCPEEIARLPDVVCRGGSCIVDRHEYFRRILCNMLGNDIQKGLLPREAFDFIGQMTENICYLRKMVVYSLHSSGLVLVYIG